MLQLVAMSAKQQTSKGDRFLKGLWLIPIVVLGYIGYMNLLPFGGTLTYLIDVGGDDAGGEARITEPFDRISNKMMVNGTTFRKLKKSGVYFETEDRRLGITEEVEVRLRFKDNFPGDGQFILGARGKEEMGYFWKDIYIPFYGQLTDLPLLAEDGNIKVYATGEESSARFGSVDEFQQNPPLGSVIARNDRDLSINQRVTPEEYGKIAGGEFATGYAFPIPLAGDIDKNGWLETNTILRGPHTFHFFASTSTLELKITKRDLNGYEGGDMLDILIYSLDGTLRAQTTIPDDGDATESRNLGDPQHSTLTLDNPERGTYKLVLESIGVGDDLVITHLGLNQPKLVATEHMLLAGNVYLNEEPEPMTMWYYLVSEGEIKFLAWHNSALQNVTVSREDYTKTLNIDTLNEWFTTGLLKPDIYKIEAEKGDIHIVAPKGYFAFTQDSLFLPTSSLNREENGTLVINTALRDASTFWTYITNGSLKLEVTKQDLNWYEGPDELKVEVYSFDGELVGSTIISDDGDEDKSMEGGPLQAENLEISGLQEGAYRIDFKCDGDLLIRQIKVNQQRFVVSKRVNLIGRNPLYFEKALPFDPVSLYLRDFRGNELRFFTAHTTGLQNISISGNSLERQIEVSKINEEFNTNLEPGSYRLTVPRQDIVIMSDDYFSFTPDSFFLPKRCEVLDLKYDLSWVRGNTDYMIVDYKDYAAPVEDNGWLVAQARWNGEDLLIKDNKLSFHFSVPHLDQVDNQEKVIPIDWIEIKLKILPLWERMGWGG